MALDIYTAPGGGEGVWHTLNAIGMWWTGRTPIIRVLMTISVMFASIWATLLLVRHWRIEKLVGWHGIVLIFMVAATVKSSNYIIKDPLTNFERPAHNVPFLLGTPYALVSQIGRFITKDAEKTFSLPTRLIEDFNVGSDKYPKFTAHGFAMPAKMIERSRRMHLLDKELESNLRAYANDCIFYIYLRGTQYTPESLMASEDMWKLVRDKASVHDRMKYVRHQVAEEMLCSAAAVKLERDWQTALEQVKKVWGKFLHPNSKHPVNVVSSELVDAYEYMAGISTTADKILQQNIMGNIVMEELGTTESDRMAEIAAARADAAQLISWKAAGKNAAKTLGAMMIVTECIIIMLFPIMLLVCVFPNGLMVAKNYYLMLIWLQLWGPLYAGLNMITNLYSRHQGLAITLDGSIESSVHLQGYKYIVALGNVADSVAGYAQWAQILIPALSYGLLRYGAGALNNMSQSIFGTTQGLHSAEGGALAKGNIDGGNFNMKNYVAFTESAHRRDTGGYSKADLAQVELNDGTRMRVTSGGESVIDQSSSYHNLNPGFRNMSSVVSGFNEQRQHSLTSAKQDATMMGSSIQSAMDGFHRLQESRGKGNSSNITEGTGLSRSQTDSLGELDQWAENAANQHHINKDLIKANIGQITGSVHAGVEAEVGYSVPLIGGAKVKGGASISGSNISEDRATEGSGESKTLQLTSQEAKDLRKAYDKVQRAFKDKSFSESDTSGKSNDQGISASLNKAKRAEESMNRNLSDAKMWQQGHSYATQSGMNMDEKMDNEFFDWMREQNHPAKGWPLTGRSDYDLQKLLNNSEYRQTLAQGFMRHKAEQFQAEFKASGLPDKDGVQQDYNDGASSMPGESSVTSNHNDNVQTVNEKVDGAGLLDPVPEDNRVDSQKLMNKLGNEQDNRTDEIKSKLSDLNNAKALLQKQINASSNDSDKKALQTAMAALESQGEGLSKAPKLPSGKTLNTSDLLIDGGKS